MLCCQISKAHGMLKCTALQYTIQTSVASWGATHPKIGVRLQKRPKKKKRKIPHPSAQNLPPLGPSEGWTDPPTQSPGPWVKKKPYTTLPWPQCAVLYFTNTAMKFTMRYSCCIIQGQTTFERFCTEQTYPILHWRFFFCFLQPDALKCAAFD